MWRRVCRIIGRIWMRSSGRISTRSWSITASTGWLTTDPTNVAERLDPELARAWQEKVADEGRLDAGWDPVRRAAELDREGITAEVLFQDFATPFIMSSPTRAASLRLAEPSIEHVWAGYRAYNRWVADFRSHAPERWLGMAAMSLHDVDAAVAELHAVKALGFAGCAIPAVPDDERLYQAKYDPFWATLDELDLVANIHVAIANKIPTYTDAPTNTAARAMVGADIFTGARNLLPTLIYGGILARYPNLTVVFTETHSDWVLGALQRLDHAYTNSDLKSDIRDVISMKPSDYWHRQCYPRLLHLLPRRNPRPPPHRRRQNDDRHGLPPPRRRLAPRHPHLPPSHLRHRTRPRKRNPPNARTNAATIYGFNLDALHHTTTTTGLHLTDILTPPTHQPHLRGDLDRPLIPA